MARGAKAARITASGLEGTLNASTTRARPPKQSGSVPGSQQKIRGTSGQLHARGTGANQDDPDQLKLPAAALRDVHAASRSGPAPAPQSPNPGTIFRGQRVPGRLLKIGGPSAFRDYGAPFPGTRRPRPSINRSTYAGHTGRDNMSVPASNRGGRLAT